MISGRPRGGGRWPCVGVAADQATKALVRANLDLGDRDSVFPGVELVHVRNRGVAFGLFADGGLVLVLIGVASVLALLVFFAPHSRRPLCGCRPGCCSAARRATSSTAFGLDAVTDFIDLPLWPAFNVADISITFGVLSLLYVLEGAPREKKHT